MAADDRADVPDQRPQDHGDEEAEDSGVDASKKRNLIFTVCEFCAMKISDQHDEDAEPQALQLVSFFGG